MASEIQDFTTAKKYVYRLKPTIIKFNKSKFLCHKVQKNCFRNY